jgi:hypothetical protein
MAAVRRRQEVIHREDARRFRDRLSRAGGVARTIRSLPAPARIHRERGYIQGGEMLFHRAAVGSGG